MSQETIENKNENEALPPTVGGASAQPVKLQDGDTLVVMLWEQRSEHDKEAIAEKFRKSFPRNDVVVLDCGAEFSIIRQGDHHD